MRRPSVFGLQSMLRPSGTPSKSPRPMQRCICCAAVGRLQLLICLSYLDLLATCSFRPRWGSWSPGPIGQRLRSAGNMETKRTGQVIEGSPRALLTNSAGPRRMKEWLPRWQHEGDPANPHLRRKRLNTRDSPCGVVPRIPPITL